MIIAKDNETKEMFEKNLQLLTPWLKEAVLSIDDEEMKNRIKVTYNEEGLPVCSYHKCNKTFHINGRNPVLEAQKWCSNISIKGTATIFLFGSEFGYALFEIFKQKQPNTLVVLFEQDLYLFKAMLSYFDFEPIIKTKKIVFIIGDSQYFADAFEHLFYSVFFVGCTFPTLTFTNSSQRNFKEEYTKIYKYVFSQLSLFVFYIGNDHKDNLIGFCNLISNVNEIIKNPYISCLKDKCKDIPAFVVANGPSLDKNIQQLKKIKSKGLIIAVESAIVPLLKNDIKPDILAVIERTENTYTYHFKNIEYPDGIALLSLALVNKNVYPSFKGAKIPILRDREVINDWVNAYLGDEIGIDAGANVSHLATEIADYLGANPITFVGQDYAYGPQRASHSIDSIYSKESGKKLEKFIQSMPIVNVEGNNGENLLSNQLWVDFRMGLERKIAVHTDKIFINATEGGSKIEGTTCDELKNVIDKYCIKELPQRIDEIIFENSRDIDISKRIEKLREFIISLEKYGKLFHQLVLETVVGKLECQKMLCLSLADDKNEHHDFLEKAYQKNIELFNRSIDDGLVRSFFQQAIFASYYFINRLGLINTPDKITEIFKIQYNLYCHLNAISQSVLVHFENSAKELKLLLKSLENN